MNNQDTRDNDQAEMLNSKSLPDGRQANTAKSKIITKSQIQKEPSFWDFELGIYLVVLVLLRF